MRATTNINGQLGRILLTAIFIAILPLSTFSMTNAKLAETTNSDQLAPREDKVKLTLIDETGTYQTIVRYKDKATENFDGRYDAYYMAGNPTNSVMYTKVQNTKFSINSLPIEHQAGIPIIIKTNAADLFTIKYQVTKGIEDYTLLLLDKDLDELYVLMGEDSITFSNEETITTDRFEILHYKKQSITTDVTTEEVQNIKVITSGAGTVINAASAMNNIAVYSITGSLLWQSNESTHNYTLPSNLPKGVAIVTVMINGNKETIKTIL